MGFDIDDIYRNVVEMSMINYDSVSLVVKGFYEGIFVE